MLVGTAWYMWYPRSTDCSQAPCAGIDAWSRCRSSALIAKSLARRRLLMVCRSRRNLPALDFPQICVKPRNENVSGLGSPRLSRNVAANRPNWMWSARLLWMQLKTELLLALAKRSKERFGVDELGRKNEEVAARFGAFELDPDPDVSTSVGSASRQRIRTCARGSASGGSQARGEHEDFGASHRAQALVEEQSCDPLRRDLPSLE